MGKEGQEDWTVLPHSEVMEGRDFITWQVALTGDGMMS